MSLQENVERELSASMIKIGHVLSIVGYDKLTLTVPEFPYNLRFVLERRDGEKGLLPAILIVTLPKSGSVYIWNHLVSSLGVKKIRVGGSYFPDDIIVEEQMQEFSVGSKICQEHLPARRLNLNIIQRYLDRLVVHVRDPRQAVLSWMHFLEKEYRELGEEIVYLRTDPPLDQNFFKWGFEERLDWYLKNHFQFWVKWIEGWVAAEENSSFAPKILFTQHLDLKERPHEFFQRILQFYGIEDHNSLIKLHEVKEGAFHFRRGLVDEWKTVFTPSQIKMTSKQISDKILRRFNWEA